MDDADIALGLLAILFFVIILNVLGNDEVDYINLQKINETALMCGNKGPKYIDLVGTSQGYHKKTIVHCHDGRVVSLEHKSIISMASQNNNQDITVETPILEKNTETKTKINLDTIKLYEEAIEAAKGCKRAEQRLLELTETQQGITTENYNEIMSSILKCKAFELESQLNKG